MNKGILIILDGYGEGNPFAYNAVTNAKTSTLHKLKKIHCKNKEKCKGGCVNDR